MERSITSYKPAISKRLFLFASGIVWLLASSIFFRKGTFFIFYYSHHILFNIALGCFAGFLVYLVLFNGMIKKHITRIVKSDSIKFFNLGLSGLNRYITLALILSVSLMLKKIHYIDLMTVNVIYICLGVIIFLSSLKFFFSVLTLKKHTESNASTI
jgi:hypothetical protein